MDKKSLHSLQTKWESQEGTANIRYDRTHTVTVDNKPPIHMTTANPLRGDAGKLNPEDLLVAAVSSCHMLSYLYLCSGEGIVVTNYTDNAVGTLTELSADKSIITEVVLNPVAIVSSADMIERAIALHHKAHDICIIANSVRFEVKSNPSCQVG
jgi:organic hydroperoxide reductase OsmC/OhrA